MSNLAVTTAAASFEGSAAALWARRHTFHRHSLAEIDERPHSAAVADALRMSQTNHDGLFEAARGGETRAALD